MTIGKSITYVSKEVLIQVREIIDGMIENYIEYEYGNWVKPEEKDYKYSNEWNQIQKGNDYY